MSEPWPEQKLVRSWLAPITLAQSSPPKPSGQEHLPARHRPRPEQWRASGSGVPDASVRSPGGHESTSQLRPLQPNAQSQYEKGVPGTQAPWPEQP